MKKLELPVWFSHLWTVFVRSAGVGSPWSDVLIDFDRQSSITKLAPVNSDGELIAIPGTYNVEDYLFSILPMRRF